MRKDVGAGPYGNPLQMETNDWCVTVLTTVTNVQPVLSKLDSFVVNSEAGCQMLMEESTGSLLMMQQQLFMFLCTLVLQKYLTHLLLEMASNDGIYQWNLAFLGI
jgi:hypothetical protein